MDSPVIVTRAEGILRIVMNRPQSLNALNGPLRKGLTDAWNQLRDDDDLKVAIISGAGGRAFSVGRDLRESAESYAEDRTLDYELAGEFGYPPRALAKPVIAAIDGYCMGSGFRIAMGAHIRLATKATQFANPQILRGRGTEMPLLLRAAGIPEGVMFDICLTGRRVSGEEAMNWGLVSRLAEDAAELDQAALEVAQVIRDGSPIVRDGIMRAHSLGLTRPGTDGAVYNQVAAMMGSTPDAKAGAAAFVTARGRDGGS